MAKYLVYVACGSAAASANVVKGRIAEYFKKAKIDVELRIARVSELPSITQRIKPDLVIITAGHYSRRGIPEDVPVVSGVPFMTMVGVQQLMDKIINILKSKKK
ncbi:MAG: hypothetical protein ACTSU6_05715 [Candidatus Njordarchaeales archaeon]